MSIAVQNTGIDRMLLPTLGLEFDGGQSQELDDAVGTKVLAIGPPFKRVALKVARAGDTSVDTTPRPEEPVQGPPPAEQQTTETPAPPAGEEGS